MEQIQDCVRFPDSLLPLPLVIRFDNELFDDEVADHRYRGAVEDRSRVHVLRELDRERECLAPSHECELLIDVRVWSVIFP